MPPFSVSPAASTAAMSSGDDRRAADLSFERKTKITGEVGAVKPSVQRPNPA